MSETRTYIRYEVVFTCAKICPEIANMRPPINRPCPASQSIIEEKKNCSLFSRSIYTSVQFFFSTTLVFHPILRKIMPNRCNDSLHVYEWRARDFVSIIRAVFRYVRAPVCPTFLFLFLFFFINRRYTLIKSDEWFVYPRRVSLLPFYRDNSRVSRRIPTCSIARGDRVFFVEASTTH